MTKERTNEVDPIVAIIANKTAKVLGMQLSETNADGLPCRVTVKSKDLEILQSWDDDYQGPAMCQALNWLLGYEAAMKRSLQIVD